MFLLAFEAIAKLQWKLRQWFSNFCRCESIRFVNDLPPLPHRQEANFSLRPAANRRHQN